VVPFDQRSDDDLGNRGDFEEDRTYEGYAVVEAETVVLDREEAIEIHIAMKVEGPLVVQPNPHLLSS
jgi:hypothetical protein